MSRWTRTLLVAIAVVALAAACGDPDGDVGGPGDTGTDGTEAPGDDAGATDDDATEASGEEGELERGEIRDDVRDAAPTELERVEVVDDTTLTAVWFSGVPDCFGLDSVDVAESDDEVRITVSTGTVGPEDQACIMIAVEWGYDVELSEPLGERTVIDGATGEAVAVP